jgi:uncharacterized protein YoxC
MQLWEIILLIICVLFTATTVFIILALQKLSATIERLDSLIAQNTFQINSIMANVNQITTETRNVVTNVSGTVGGINRVVSVINAETTADSALTVRKAFDTAKFVWNGVKYFRDRKERKEMKVVLKQAKSRT